MLAIGRGASYLIVTPTHRCQNATSILVALGDAGIGVSQIESHSHQVGTYQLTVDDRSEEAVRILVGIGCSATVRAGSLVGPRP